LPEITAFDGASHFPVGHNLVLASPGTSRLYLLNESARYIWERYRQGRSSEQIAARLARRYGIGLATARRDVAATIDGWRKTILSEPEQPAAAASAISWDAVRGKALPAPLTRDYVVNGKAVRLVMWDQSLADDLAPRLEPLHRAGKKLTPATVIDACVEGDQAFVFRDRQCVAAESPAAARFTVLEQMIRIGWPETHWTAFLHAGVVTRSGACVVFPAVTGSGKSTLAAALVHAGFDLLTDDLASLHCPSGSVAAVPLAVQLRAGSWPVLRSRFSGIDDLPIIERRGQQLRFLSLAAQSPPSETRSMLARCRAVVFTQFVEGAEVESGPVSTWDALCRMDEIGFWITPDDDSTQAFLSWLDAIPKFQLTYSDLDDAVGVISALVES
jgi:hypothetical protein